MAAKTTEEDMEIDKIKKQKVQHLVNNISEGFNLSDGKPTFMGISPYLEVISYMKKYDELYNINMVIGKCHNVLGRCI